MHDQLRWMREHNRACEQQVSFCGIDVPGWCANPGPGVAACMARLDSRPGDDALLADADLGGPAHAPGHSAGPGAASGTSSESA